MTGTIETSIHFVLDICLLVLLFMVNGLEDLVTTVKLFTSVSIGLFTLVRIYFYFKDRLAESKKVNNESTEDR